MYGYWSSYTGNHNALFESSKEFPWEKKNLNMRGAGFNWLDAGASKHKIILSIAFYGRSFTLKDQNQFGLHAPINGPGPGEDGGFLRYYEVCIITIDNSIIISMVSDLFELHESKIYASMGR